MLLTVPYKGYRKIAPIEVPDENPNGVHEPKSAGKVDEAAIRPEGFAGPFGARRLRDVIKIDKRMRILIEDEIRATATTPGRAETLFKPGAPMPPVMVRFAVAVVFASLFAGFAAVGLEAFYLL